jgi:hypothetical protein
MATRSKNRSKSRASRRTRSQRGGAQGAYPDSAWGFQMNNLGNGWTQFMNSLSVQPGANLGTSQSNNIVPINNTNGPVKMTGGKRGRRRAQMQQQQQQQSRGKGRGKKGGYWGAVLEQAAVPLALLGMQQFYGKRHSRRHPGHDRSFRRRH